MAYLLLVGGDFFATRPCRAVFLCFRSFRKFSLAYCLSCLVFALFVRVPHFCIEMIFDNRLTFFCDCARFFLRAMRLVFLRISRKSYSGFMCLAASLPDAAVGRWRVFCVNGGTFCLDGAIPFFFFVVFFYSGLEYRNILRCIFRFFVLLFFLFLPRLLCVLCRSRNCRRFCIYRPPLLPTAIRRVFY